MELLNKDNLSHAALYVTSRDIVWRDWLTRWEVVYPSNIREENEDHCELEPVMNYYYELPDLCISASKVQVMLMGLPLIIVCLDDEPVLALSGGGMNFSWEICEAYILLGYLPPLYFALPHMAGSCKKHVLDACIESGKVAERKARNHIQNHEELYEFYKKEI